MSTTVPKTAAAGGGSAAVPSLLRRLATPSQTTTRSLSSVYIDFLASGKMDLSPSYQRHRCWKQWQNNGLINSIMLNWPTPLLTFYKLHSTNPDDAAAYAAGRRYECVDGQNRLAAVQAFRADASLVDDKGKEEGVFWTRDGSGLADVRYSALTEEEKEYFDTYNVAVTIIQEPMTLAERKAMFMRLQDGTRISVAEYMRNTEHPVSLFVSRNGLREKFLPVITGLMTGAKGDWMDVLADCVTLYLRRAEAAPFEVLDRTQSDLRQVLKCKRSAAPGTKYDMPLTEGDDATLLPLFEQLIATLTAAKGDKIKCHKFHVTVLFQYLLTGAPVPPTAVLHAWFKTHKDIARALKDGTRSPEVYVAQLEFLQAGSGDDSDASSSTGPAPKRRSIPKSKRKEIWSRHFGAATSGTCLCCEKPITDSSWEQAHIVAVAEGGTNDIRNLVPTCQGCNRECGKENLRDWCAREWRTAPFLSLVL